MRKTCVNFCFFFKDTAKMSPKVVTKKNKQTKKLLIHNVEKACKKVFHRNGEGFAQNRYPTSLYVLWCYLGKKVSSKQEENIQWKSQNQLHIFRPCLNYKLCTSTEKSSAHISAKSQCTWGLIECLRGMDTRSGEAALSNFSTKKRSTRKEFTPLSALLE